VSTEQSEVNKNIDESLKVLRTIYAVLYVVGFREVLSSIDLSQGILHALIRAFLPGSVLVLIAVRMFWAVGNIRRYADQVEKTYLNTYPRDESVRRHIFEGRTGVYIMIFDVPVLLLHSFAFFLLCKLMPIVLASNYALGSVRDFLAVFCALLVLNVVWLLALMIRDRRLACAPQTVWLMNNVAFAVLSAAAWLASSARHELIPDGATLFWISMALCGFNSLVDLRLTAWAYLVGPPG